ncbi:beta-galactosidase [Bacteroidota bacterium]
MYRNTLTKILTAFCVLFVAIPAHSQTPEETAREKIDSLEALVTVAEAMGISAESEKMTLRAADVYLKFADWDEANESINVTWFEKLGAFKDSAATLAKNLPDFERKQVIEILDDATVRMGLLIDSVYTRKTIPKVDWAKARLSGNTIIQDERPVFLLDHTWKPATPELEEFFGALDGYYISPSHVENETGNINSWELTKLTQKPGGNIGSIFIDHTNIPDWAKTKYDSFTVSSRLFSKYDIDHPGARELYGYLFKGMVPKMAGKNYTKLGYMLFNEPSFFTQANVWNNGEVSNYTKEKFRVWLGQRHDSIAALNSLWGSSFESFDSVKITIPIFSSHEGTPMWYDWMLFNNHRVTDYFRFLKNEIRKYDPDALVHIKLMPWLWTGDKKDHGMDFEALTRLCDISGSDAQAKNSRWWGDWGDWSEKFSFEWLEISMTYDFFRSIRPDQIIFDTENHYLSTGHFRDLYLKSEYARATYWLAHMHGLNAGRSWYWGRNESGEPKSQGGSGYPGSYAQQPRILNEMHETLIDLNNYSEEITAIQQQVKPLRIYFSLTNAINRSTYMKDVFENYESVYFEGVPLGFATDSILIDREPGDFEAVLIWKTESVTLQEFNTLQAYLDSGGTVIMDAGSFKTNEYGKAHGSLSPGKGNLLIAGSLSDMKTKALDLIGDKDLFPEITVTETNSIGPKACMWRCIKNDHGNNVLSLINLGKTNANLKIELPAAEHGTACWDLVNGLPVSTDTILPPDGILLLEVTAAEEVVDTNTNVSIQTVQSGNMASLYPNPSSGSFYIDLLKTHEKIDLLVYDFSGVNLYSASYHSTNRITCRMDGHPDGMYIIRLRSAEGIQSFLYAKQQLN